MNNHRVIALFLSCSWLSPPEYYGIGIQRKLSDRAIAPLHPGFIEKLLRDGCGALHSSRLAFTVRIFFTVRISRPTNCVGAGGFHDLLFRWCGSTGFTFTLRHSCLILSCDPSHFLPPPYGGVPGPAEEPDAFREDAVKVTKKRNPKVSFENCVALTEQHRRSNIRAATDFTDKLFDLSFNNRIFSVPVFGQASRCRLFIFPK